MATALIQWVMRTQAGWIVGAGAASSRAELCEASMVMARSSTEPAYSKIGAAGRFTFASPRNDKCDIPPCAARRRRKPAVADLRLPGKPETGCSFRRAFACVMQSHRQQDG